VSPLESQSESQSEYGSALPLAYWSVSELESQLECWLALPLVSSLGSELVSPLA
jgi:hypothetical protein